MLWASELLILQAFHLDPRMRPMRKARFRSSVGILAILAFNIAYAQHNVFTGTTPKPTDLYPLAASLIATRTAPDGGSSQVVPAFYTHVTTRNDTKTYEWASLTILSNRSDFGANVASYSQALKTGRGTTWGAINEIQDSTGRGGFFGLEVDAVTTGPSPRSGPMGGDRIGVGIFVGRAFNFGPKATVDYGIFIAPTGLRDQEADLNFGMMVWAQCQFACFAMRAGNKIAFEESGVIVNKFDPGTGRWGLHNGERPLFEVDVATGELLVNGKPIQLNFKDQ